MDIPDGVIPERFHPTALKAGLSQADLPCGDPSCGAEPGQPCGPFCTHGDAGVPTIDDLVPVSHHEFAIRDCPRCNGTGHYTSSPHQEDCRCRLDATQARKLHELDTSIDTHLRRLRELLGSSAYVGEVHRKRSALIHDLDTHSHRGTKPTADSIAHADALVTVLRLAIETAEQIAVRLRLEAHSNG